MIGLIVGNIVGVGIFGVTSELTRLLGRPSPLAMVLEALGMGVIMVAIAEVPSQFSEAAVLSFTLQLASGALRRCPGRLVLATFPYWSRGRVRESLRGLSCTICAYCWASFGPHPRLSQQTR